VDKWYTNEYGNEFPSSIKDTEFLGWLKIKAAVSSNMLIAGYEYTALHPR
jgi:hypothetical protein